jgi:hypothetical protein
MTRRGTSAELGVKPHAFICPWVTRCGCWADSCSVIIVVLDRWNQWLSSPVHRAELAAHTKYLWAIKTAHCCLVSKRWCHKTGLWHCDVEISQVSTVARDVRKSERNWPIGELNVDAEQPDACMTRTTPHPSSSVKLFRDHDPAPSRWMVARAIGSTPPRNKTSGGCLALSDTLNKSDHRWFENTGSVLVHSFSASSSQETDSSNYGSIVCPSPFSNIITVLVSTPITTWFHN